MKSLYIYILIFFCIASSFAQSYESSPNVIKFMSPDSSFYLGVWWHWRGLPTNKEALTRDLVAMKSKKIRSVQMFSYNMSISDSSSHFEKTTFPWHALAQYAIEESNRLNLEYGICVAGSTAGWSQPWIPLDEMLQRLVFSEFKINGGSKISQGIALPLGLDLKENGKPLYYEDIALLAFPTRQIIQPTEVKDITVFYKNGILTWTAPQGCDWTILRIGHTAVLKPGTFDPLRTDCFDHFYIKYMGNWLSSMSESTRRTIKYMIADSWEAGNPQWTKNFQSIFFRLCHYNILPYLPVLNGKIIGSKETSRRFLEDYKRTISQLFVQQFQHQQQIYHQNGFLVMNESSGPNLHFADGIWCQKFSDVPMGEFWARATTHRVTVEKRFLNKEAVSAGHVYGKKIISAEAFTSIGPQWEEYPWYLKPTADRAFCEGINLLYFHAYSHSPSPIDKPGNVYMAGSHIDRNVTWWNMSYDWNEYLIRCQYMLQQGSPCSDLCYYTGPNIQRNIIYKKEAPGAGFGYSYDYVNDDVILHEMNVHDGKIQLRCGQEYSALVLQDSKEISIEILNKIHDFVRQGAIVIGPQPQTATGLFKAEGNDQKVKKIDNELWGKGLITDTKDIRSLLIHKDIQPDLYFISTADSIDIDFNHRHTNDAEIYFIANLRNKGADLQLSFRQTGLTPQLWLAETGKVVPQNIFTDNGNRINMPLQLKPYGSVFVVFKKAVSLFSITSVKPKLPHINVLSDGRYQIEDAGRYIFVYSDGRKRKITVPKASTQTIEAPWKVDFEHINGAPGEVVFPKLISWTESDNKNIKYFSGTATYCKKFLFTKKAAPDERIYIDLGEMFFIAEIHINGQNIGTCWSRPFQKEITQYIKKGWNTLEIHVANLWPNRLIGDLFLSEEERYTKTNITKFTKDSQLMPSGLLGPVKIISYRTFQINSKLFKTVNDSHRK